MPGQVAGSLCMVSGAAAMAVGMLLARRRLRTVTRAHRKRGLVHAALPEGWGVWFFQGFADVTMGTRWVVAILLLVFWVGLGVGLVSLGIHLLS